MGRNNSKLRRQYRKEEATGRQSLSSERSPEEQALILDRRLGDGIGAAKERKRLEKKHA